MYFGIDLGGSHIGIGLVKEDYQIIEKKEFNFTYDYDKKFIVNTCIQMINEILDNQKLSLFQIDYIGIGCPGRITDTKIIKANNMGLYNFEIIEEFRKNPGYSTIPIYLENDANCATVAEFLCGSLNGVNNGIMLTIGTGIGAGIIINKKLYKGNNGTAGEIGHMCIKKDGLECTCGQKGCFEKYASMKALKTRITKELGLSKEISGQEISILLDNGNIDVINIFNEIKESLVLGIVNVINLFDPEKVVIGGSMAYYKQWLIDDLNILVNQKLYNNGYIYPIEFATAGNDAGIIGAAFQNKLKD